MNLTDICILLKNYIVITTVIMNSFGPHNHVVKILQSYFNEGPLVHEQTMNLYLGM